MGLERYLSAYATAYASLRALHARMLQHEKQAYQEYSQKKGLDLGTIIAGSGIVRALLTAPEFLLDKC